jgi:DNA-binding NarL/FixJ family response regulator
MRESSGLECTTIALVDDCIEFAQTARAFLAQHPDFHVLGIVHSQVEFQALVRKKPPHVSLIDLNMSKSGSGRFLLRWLVREFPNVRPVVLAVEEGEVLSSFALGAKGYVLKSNLNTLAPTLREVSGGQLGMPAEVREIFVRQSVDQWRMLHQRLDWDHLSRREREVMDLLVSGCSREKAARSLGISYYTVRRHLQNLLEKTGEPTIRDLLAKYGGSSPA